MIYAMSDIHGCLEPLKAALGRVDLTGDNKLVLCGDYIDYGYESGQVLRFLYALQKEHGADKVVVLRGNHEEMLLEWLDAFHEGCTGMPDETGYVPWSEWLDTDRDCRTFRTLISERQWEQFEQMRPTASDTAQNIEAVRMVRATSGDLLRWLRRLPYFYETERQIFVHAGVDEEAGEDWEWGTPGYVYVGKYPAADGAFYKDIIAGHIGTASLSGDPDFHGVWHDGASHWYIDGTVTVSGRIPVLAYDEQAEVYREL